MVFHYRKLEDGHYSPIAPVSLLGKTGWFLFNAFVDSGADYSVFHSKVAVGLGLHLKGGTRRTVTVGDGDSMTVYLHTLPVRFAGYQFKAQMAFSEGLGAGFNLLGRKTFFERFWICFNDDRKILRVKSLGILKPFF